MSCVVGCCLCRRLHKSEQRSVLPVGQNHFSNCLTKMYCYDIMTIEKGYCTKPYGLRLSPICDVRNTDFLEEGGVSCFYVRNSTFSYEI